MFGIPSLMDSARKCISPDSRQASDEPTAIGNRTRFETPGS